MAASSSTGELAPIHIHREAPQLNRRQALSLMAASMALANGACSAPPNEIIVPYVDMPEAQAVGMPLYYASAFVRDGYAQGVLVSTKEGRPIKIEGNPLHPSSLGATDVFAQASVLQLWDPDRSQAVRERLGTKADVDGAHAASSWPAFEAAWRSRVASSKGQGSGLRVLTGPLTSPTQRALLNALLQRNPGARWHVHAPTRDAAAAAGLRAALGRDDLAPVLQLRAARCVLALAADPFSEGPGAVRHAMDWAEARAQGRAGGIFPRLLAAEVQPGLFGARADARIALPPARIEAMLWRIARRWLPELPALAPAEPQEARFEAQALQALAAAGADSLVIAGAGLSSEAHQLVCALNQRLGALGRSLALIAAPDAAPDAGTLSELAQAMNAGEVDTLLVLDCNPAYDAPAELGLRQALARVPLTVHAGLYADETAALCRWHLPLSHAYEQWGDALAHDGSACLLQPAISPLYDSRSAVELLALLSDDAERGGHALVQRQWRTRGDPDFEAFWQTSLRRGVVSASAAPALQVGRAAVPSQPPAAAASELVAVFAPDPSLHDGRFANLGWLQELPRPFTKLTWDNALLIGTRTAARLKLATGDLVQARIGRHQLDVPVWVSERHADNAVTLPLGYGRWRAGRVGTGVGFDAYALQPLSAAPVPITLHPLGRHHAFAVTQHTLDQADREIVRAVRPGKALSSDDLRHPSLYPEYTYPEHAWAMAVDLDACIGCNACTIACQSENNIPVVGKEQVALGREMHWIRVDRYDTPEIGNTSFQPLPCMQCEKAPCELVCPVGATVHDSEGINVQIYNRCVGTRFCSNNCPYKVRRFNFLQFSDPTTETLKAQRNPDVTVRQRGVMEKCNYCLQRVTRARHHAEQTGRPIGDGDVLTACQAVCPTRAIHFGDLNDAASDIRRQRVSPRHYALLGELNTQPRTTYLARVIAHEPDTG